MRIDKEQVDSILQDYSRVELVKNLMSQQAINIKHLKHIGIEKLYLCHATNFFPKNGVIYPRLNFGFSERNAFELGEELSSSISTLFSIVRPTVHFTLNSTATLHKDHSGFGSQPFIIIDPLMASTQIAGGYIEDMFTFGPYILTNQATILAPKTKREHIQESIKTLPNQVKVIYYENYEESIKQFFKDKNSDYLNTQGIIQSADEPVFYGKLGKEMVSSSTLLKWINRKFCTHDITYFSQIENMLSGNEVYNQPPFLSILHNPSWAIATIDSYLQGIKEHFIFTKEQEIYFDKYKSILMQIASLALKSATTEELINSVSINKDILKSYDHPISLNKMIPIQQGALLLSSFSGVKFNAYYRKSSHYGLVDAAYLLPDTRSADDTLSQLRTTFQLNFILETHNNKAYIVLKDINLQEIGDVILSRFNDYKQSCLSK